MALEPDSGEAACESPPEVFSAYYEQGCRIRFGTMSSSTYMYLAVASAAECNEVPLPNRALKRRACRSRDSSQCLSVDNRFGIRAI